jgi:protein TonB
MKRYVNSFFITLFIYLILAGTFFVILANSIVIKKEVKKNKTISLKHINLIEKIESKLQKVEKVQIPQVIKKHKEIQVLKKKIKKKVIKKKKRVKKKIKKKILKRTVIKKHIEKKEEIVEQKIVKEIIKTKLVEKVFTKTQVIKKAIPYKEDFLRKNLY